MRSARTSANVCLKIAATSAVLLAIFAAPPARAADDSEDGEPDASPVCENPPSSEQQAARAGRISTEELYDLTPFDEVDAGFKVLREAFTKKQWLAVIKQAPEVAERGRQSGLAAATWMLRARAHEALKQWPDAERSWQRLAQSGVLAQRARLHLADLALKRKDVGEALVQLAAVAPWHVARDEATLTMARLELERDHVGPARDALERIEQHHLRPEQRGMYSYLQGEVQHRSGHDDEARNLYRQSWSLDSDPYSAKAGKRLGELQAAPSPADQIERILKRREVKPGQLKGWLREAEAITEEDSGLRLYVQGSLWIRDRNNRARAVEALRKALESLTDPVQVARGLYAYADALGKTGEDQAGIAALQQIATVLQGQNSPAAAEVSARSLARLHRLYNAVDRPGDALAALRKLLDLHPDAEERELVVWGLGWQHFLAGNYPAALELFVKLEREHGNLWTGAQQPWRAKAIYWQARCLQQMGQTEAALEAWASVTNTYAQTYYGILSLDRIAEIDADRAVRLQGPPPSPTGAETPPASLARLRVTRSQALDEAAILLRAGLPGEAKALLSEQLSKGLPRDGVHLLATLYDIGGNRRLAFGVMSRHTRRAARPDDSTAQVWRQSFPRAFYDEVDAATAQAAIGRSTLYAIVRHESAFVPTVVSKAGAYGLVQVLPSAARAVSDLYDLPYGGTGALLRPATNLQVGALYLAQLMSFFKGNLPLVAAAYNAGPYAARDWVKRWQNQPTDVFVENIPYPATRAYVMQVTASAQTYAWLYPEWQEISAGPLLRTPGLPHGFGPFMQKPGAGSAALVN
jgi:soluble lytic murein transglycosylase-like protein